MPLDPTKGSRTLDVAKTPTLVEDTSGSNAAGTLYSGNLLAGFAKTMIGAGADVTGATVTPTFAAGSRAVGVAVFKGFAPNANTIKLRLYMGGVDVAESGYIPISDSMTLVTGSMALSGAKAVEAVMHNYNASAQYPRSGGYDEGDPAQKGFGVGVGSIKI